MSIAERLKARSRRAPVTLADDLVVMVRGLSLGGKLKYQSRLTDVDAKGNVIMKADADYASAAADVLIECVLEEDGSPAFKSAEDIAGLDSDDASKLFDKARELSGLTADAENAIEKNS